MHKYLQEQARALTLCASSLKLVRALAPSLPHPLPLPHPLLLLLLSGLPRVLFLFRFPFVNGSSAPARLLRYRFPLSNRKETNGRDEQWGEH